MEKILVTGGAGFIGSHTVVELHSHGFHPVIVDNFSNSHHSVLESINELCDQKIDHFDADCTDREALRAIFANNPGITGVIHFAAYKAVGESVREPLKYYRNNVGSLITLTEVMEEFGVKNLVFSSSCTVYGQPDELPVTEDFPLLPANSPYGFTKQVCEQLLIDASNGDDNQLTSVLLRYFNPIGAHPSGLLGELPLGTPENLVPFITQTAAGLRDELVIYGDNYDTVDGTCVRDYIHVVDLAKAHVIALDWLNNNPRECGVFNLGTGAGHSVRQVIETFEEVNNTNLRYRVGDRRPGDVEKIYANADKARRELNWQCEFSLADCLKDAWKWQQTLKSKEVFR